MNNILTEFGPYRKIAINNLTFYKNLTLNKFNVSLIAKTLKKDTREIIHIIETNLFNYIVSLYDKSFKIPNYIYMYRDNEEIKIKNNLKLDTKNKQPKKIYEELIRVIEPKNMKEAKEEINNILNKDYPNEKSFIRKFDNTVKYIIYDNYHNNTFADNDNILNFFNNNNIYYVKKYKKYYEQGFFVSDLVLGIILNIISNFDFNNTMNILNNNTMDINNYYIYHKESNIKFVYWKFDNIITIMNMNNKKINSKILWETINKDHTRSFGEIINVSKVYTRNTTKEERKLETYKSGKIKLINGSYIISKLWNIALRDFKSENELNTIKQEIEKHISILNDMDKNEEINNILKFFEIVKEELTHFYPTVFERKTKYYY